TDSKGRTVSFKNAVIILTSNAGAQEAQNAGFATGEHYERMKERVTETLKERFRPEFLNRMDDIIVFHPLSQADCVKIGDKIIASLAKRLQEQRGVTLTVTQRALYALVEEGYDPLYGARPLKRVVRRRIEDRLSEEILMGKVGGGKRVTVDYINGEYLFS
ncbi:MAG: ATP-dependent Clp protease ATP-binding subunit, partial [Clostridia bacterium]|nr:ATP-dependent Clp protease ATP-binding subunit [Clostridia bacterium]